MKLTAPTTAAQLAAEHCRDPHEVACELADACRAGLIGGREFNGKIIYHPIPTERTMNAIEELRALPRVSIQKTYVSGGNATCVADGFVQSFDAEAIVTRQQAEIDDLWRQLAEVTKERDTEAIRADQANSEASQSREQLATLNAQLTDWMDTAEALYKAVPVAYERGQLPKNGKRKPSEMVREYLGEIEAEAAAMRAAIFAWMTPGERMSGLYSGKVNAIFDAAANGTAGRDMLAEMRRKDERIAELEAQIRDGVTAAYNAAEKAWDAKEDGPKPVEAKDSIDRLIRERDAYNERCDELRQQLAAQAELVKLAEELREWLITHTRDRSNGKIEFVNPTMELHDSFGRVLRKPHDTKGGA